jgi:hypothetical protein
VISHPLRRMARGLIATAVLAGVASAQTPTKPPPPPPDHQHMPGIDIPDMCWWSGGGGGGLVGVCALATPASTAVAISPRAIRRSG